ncbi:MAG: heme-binding domain-containing protein [Anaerolineales bacterium]|nr:heme-binding domain-containing protein [Anaerolineales bacterium]
MRKLVTLLMIAAIVLVVLALLIQVLPYGHTHTNPPLVKEPNWNSPETRQIAQKACFDCHSNETIWPWYSNIAPMSWLVQRDVDVARSRMNFSDWGRISVEVGEIIEIVSEGEMPPFQYLLMHPGARLSEQEKTRFIDGINATLNRP